MSSPYSSVLRRLIDRVDGGLAAGFADYEGETVQIEGSLEDYAHRLHLAVQGIMLHSLQSIRQAPADAPRLITSCYQKLRVIVRPLKGGYYLVLTLKRDSNLYQARLMLESAAEELDEDL